MSPLDQMLAIERRGDWPAARAAYHAALLELVEQLEDATPHALAAVVALMAPLVAPLLICHDPAERQARADVWRDVQSGPGWARAQLSTVARGVNTATRANIRSMLKAAYIWRCNDLLESGRRRHDRRVVLVGDCRTMLEECAAPALEIDRRLLLEQLLRHFVGPVEHCVLECMLGGGTVTDAARAAGVSRQRVYRLFRRMRKWSTETVTRAA